MLCNTFFTCARTIGTQWEHHIRATSIRRQCNFADRKINVVSTLFFQLNFEGEKTHVISTYLFRCSFDDWNIHLFPLTFFNVILTVEKSTLFTRTFFDEISTGKNLRSFLVKLQANENIRGGLPLLATLKNWLLLDCSP